MTDDGQDETLENLQLSTRSLLANFSSKSEQIKECKSDLKKLLNEGLDYQASFDISKNFLKKVK